MRKKLASVRLNRAGQQERQSADNGNLPTVQAGVITTISTDGAALPALLPGTHTPPIPKPKPSLPPISPRFRQPPDYPTDWRARVIYGETSGLFPTLKNPNKSPYDSGNWDPNSALELAKARAYVGIVAERNHGVHFDQPRENGGFLDERAWNQSLDAATTGYKPKELDLRVQNFFIRKAGSDKKPNWPSSIQYSFSLGPFHGASKADGGTGSGIYIDFYIDTTVPVKSSLFGLKVCS